MHGGVAGGKNTIVTTKDAAGAANTKATSACAANVAKIKRKDEEAGLL